MEGLQDDRSQTPEDLHLAEAREQAGRDPPGRSAPVSGHHLGAAVDRRWHEQEQADGGAAGGRRAQREQREDGRRVPGEQPDAAGADRRAPAADRQAAVGDPVAPEPRRRPRPERGRLVNDRGAREAGGGAQ